MIEAGSVQWNDEREFRLRLPGGHTEAFYGVNFVDGVSDAPVIARTVLRMYQAFGAVLTIELWTLPSADPPPAKTRAVASLGGSHPPGSVDRAGRPFADRDLGGLADLPDADSEPDSRLPG